jgi:hypothetical protein
MEDISRRRRNLCEEFRRNPYRVQSCSLILLSAKAVTQVCLPTWNFMWFKKSCVKSGVLLLEENLPKNYKKV